MPENASQWIMFFGFAVGAVGGILYLVQLIAELVQAVMIARRAGVDDGK